MNYLAGKHLNRRTFLKGLGATMALPVLDAMTPAAVAANSTTVAADPKRMVFVYLPNGVIMEKWTPEGDSTALNLSQTMKPLANVRDDMNVISGLAQMNGRALGDGGGDHARAAATFLTGVHPYKTAGSDIRAAISADQVAAQIIGDQTRLPSLELTLEPGRRAGNCDTGYSCAYSNSISWRTEHTPNPPEHNPRQVFERLFGGFDSSATPEERAKQRKYRQSVLDVVSDDTKKLMKKLGKSDQQKLDEYLYAVRKLELRVETSEELEEFSTVDFETPADKRPSDFAEYAKLMYDLQVLALSTDQTRIITFMVGAEGSGRQYKELDVTGGHHEISHHLHDKKKVSDLEKINHYHMEHFAYFLEQIKGVEEQNGTLLDNSMVLCGSGLSDGNRHAHYDLPLILAGKGGGSVKTGRHLQYAKETPMNNLFLSMLDRMGVHTEELGDSTGKLEHLSDLI